MAGRNRRRRLLGPGSEPLTSAYEPVDLAVVDEAAFDGGLVALADVDEALVELGALVVASLPELRNRRADTGRVPGAEVANTASPALAGVLALTLLDAPSLDGTLRTLTLRDSRGVEVLAGAEHVGHLVFATVLDKVEGVVGRSTRTHRRRESPSRRAFSSGRSGRRRGRCA